MVSRKGFRLNFSFLFFWSMWQNLGSVGLGFSAHSSPGSRHLSGCWKCRADAGVQALQLTAGCPEVLVLPSVSRGPSSWAGSPWSSTGGTVE